MTIASATSQSDASPAHGLERCKDAVSAAERLLHLARVGVRKSVEAAGGIDAAQAAAHGLA
jgi:(2S)-methylsuccinyl-CoA dehydrogenase